MEYFYERPAEFKNMGYNFMTPRIKGYLRLKDGRAVEISTGTGFKQEPIFGVTIRPDPKNQSKMVCSLQAAEDYIEELNDDNTSNGSELPT